MNSQDGSIKVKPEIETFSSGKVSIDKVFEYI